MKILKIISESVFVQIIVTLIVYAFYALVIGISLIPTTLLVFAAFKNSLFISLSSGNANLLGNAIFFSLSVGFGIYLYFLTGIFVMGGLVRLISIGIKPGKYPAVSLTMLRWLIYSGIYTIAHSTILPVVRMTFFTNLFFKIIGCKMGKNVYLNTWTLNDPYLIELGDNVIIGGDTDLTCHIFENNYLILDKIKIGKNSLVGAHCYIMPGVTVGENCVIGVYSFIRRNKRILDNSKITALSGLPVKDIYRIERGKTVGSGQ
jgi:acetyltransferase-like isoleucine patch superfamily enzyme